MADLVGEPTPGAEEVLGPIERSATLGVTAGEFRPARMARLAAPRPRLLPTVGRILAWMSTFLRIGLGDKLDGLLGRGTEEGRAQRVRRLLGRMRPTARKVASAFSFRLDQFPPALAFELAFLDDSDAPIPIRKVIALVEKATGRPMTEIFARLDPEPLGVRVVRSTYLGLLHDGQQVTVAVRRPGVRQLLAEELAALRLISVFLEGFSLIRPGMFRYLYAETEELLLDETDFRVASRSQVLFCDRLRRDRIHRVGAPWAYTDWVDEAVRISKYQEGLPLSVVLGAVERGDEALLGRLAEQGIRPQRIARDLLDLAWWEIQENLFFHSEPRAVDVLIRPGGKLLIAHFDDCATTTGENRRLVAEIFRRLDEDDVSGATQLLVQLVAPLPFIDVHTFTKQVEARLWHQLFALRDPNAAWWERTSAGLWSALLDVTRAHGVPVHLDLIRVMRCSIMFEALAAQLDPGFDPLRAFRRHRRRADLRTARRWIREGAKEAKRGSEAAVIARAAELETLVERGLFFARTTVDSLPVAFLAMPRKAAYVSTVAMQWLLTVAVLFGAGTAMVALTTESSWSEAALRVGTHAGFVVVALIITLIATRRMLFRLADADRT